MSRNEIGRYQPPQLTLLPDRTWATQSVDQAVSVTYSDLNLQDDLGIDPLIKEKKRNENLKLNLVIIRTLSYLPIL